MKILILLYLHSFLASLLPHSRTCWHSHALVLTHPLLSHSSRTHSLTHSLTYLLSPLSLSHSLTHSLSPLSPSHYLSLTRIPYYTTPRSGSHGGLVRGMLAPHHPHQPHDRSSPHLQVKNDSFDTGHQQHTRSTHLSFLTPLIPHTSQSLHPLIPDQPFPVSVSLFL